MGKRWPPTLSKLHPDYLTGLDYLVTEQPDRALDMFLNCWKPTRIPSRRTFPWGRCIAGAAKSNAPSGSIRISCTRIARARTPEQALLALAQDYLRAGLLDRRRSCSNK